MTKGQMPSSAPSDDRDTLVGHLVRRVLDRSLAEQMLAEFTVRIPSFRRIPTVLRRRLLDNIEATNELGIHYVLAGDRASGPAGIPAAQLETVLELPRAAAEAGMPLTDLLRSYPLGVQVGLRRLEQKATAAERAVLHTIALRLFGACEHVCAAVTDMYLAERPDLLDDDEQSARELRDSIINQRVLTARQEQERERFGFRAADRYRVFCAAKVGASATWHAYLARVLRTQDVLAVCDGAMVRGLTGPDHAARDLPELGELLIAEEGQVHPAQLVEVDQDVRGSMHLAAAQGRTAGPVTVTEFLPELLVRRSPLLAARLQGEVLSPLADEPELRETAKAVATLGWQPTALAAHLHTHRNTLLYRLNRILALTGRDLRNPRHLAEMYLAFCGETLP